MDKEHTSGTVNQSGPVDGFILFLDHFDLHLMTQWFCLISLTLSVLGSVNCTASRKMMYHLSLLLYRPDN